MRPFSGNGGRRHDCLYSSRLIKGAPSMPESIMTAPDLRASNVLPPYRIGSASACVREHVKSRLMRRGAGDSMLAPCFSWMATSLSFPSGQAHKASTSIDVARQSTRLKISRRNSVGSTPKSGDWVWGWTELTDADWLRRCFTRFRRSFLISVVFDASDSSCLWLEVL